MATAAERDHLRREGMADAAVLLLAKRVFPTLTLNDWRRHLDLTEAEVAAAVDRIKARAAALHRPNLRAVPAPRASRTGERRARKFTPAADGTWPCPADGCTAVYGDGRGLATHHRACHQPVTCPSCGKETNAAGIGPHRRTCLGVEEAPAS